MEHAPRNPDHAMVLADLDPELHGLPLGGPAGVLGERRLGKGDPRAILLKAAVGASGRQREMANRQRLTYSGGRVIE